MRILTRLSVFLAVAVLFLTANSQTFAKCGTERWAVKVVQDQHNKYFFQNNDISTGKLQVFIKTTIADLHAEAYPFNLGQVRKFPPKWAQDQRAGQVEFRMWTITGILTEKKNEADEDYHLIIHDLKDKSRTLVAEIPSENCVEDTPEPIKSMIIQTRNDFNEWFNKQPNKKKLNQKVRITGMGFFDRVHGAEGESPNGVELHPLIKIAFLKK